MKNLLCLLILLFVSACDSPLRHMEPEEFVTPNSSEVVSLTDKYNVEVRWINGPYPLPNKASHIEVVVLDKDLNLAQVSEGDQFFIQADMGMGHGLANSGVFSSSDLSTWINSTLSFYMGGDYLIKLYLFDENFNQLGLAEWRVVF